jgi:hypothetical protein
VAVEAQVRLPKADSGVQARSRPGAADGKPASPSARGVVRQLSALSASSVSSSGSSSAAAPPSLKADVRSRVI